MFEYDFKQRAFFAGMIMAVLASGSGSFIVLRQHSMMTKRLAHFTLEGVAVGLLLGSSPLWTAVVLTLVRAWTIEYLRSFYNLYSDTNMAIFLSGLLVLAVMIVSSSGALNSSLFSYLFGPVLSVCYEDILTMLVVGGAVLMVILLVAALYYRQRFARRIWLALVFALVSVIIGVTSSYCFSLPGEATIVITALVFFIVLLVINLR